MNRFRKLGFISYNGRIHVNKSLLNVVLLDQLPEHNNAQKPAIPIAGIILKPVVAVVSARKRKSIVGARAARAELN